MQTIICHDKMCVGLTYKRSNNHDYFIDIDNMEILLKVVINADNLTDSTADFDFNLKAREMYKPEPDSWEGDWLPGNYNLTGSLKVLEVDIGR